MVAPPASTRGQGDVPKGFPQAWPQVPESTYPALMLPACAGSTWFRYNDSVEDTLDVRLVLRSDARNRSAQSGPVPARKHHGVAYVVLK